MVAIFVTKAILISPTTWKQQTNNWGHCMPNATLFPYLCLSHFPEILSQTLWSPIILGCFLFKSELIIPYLIFDWMISYFDRLPCLYSSKYLVDYSKWTHTHHNPRKVGALKQPIGRGPSIAMWTYNCNHLGMDSLLVTFFSHATYFP